MPDVPLEGGVCCRSYQPIDRPWVAHRENSLMGRAMRSPPPVFPHPTMLSRPAGFIRCIQHRDSGATPHRGDYVTFECNVLSGTYVVLRNTWQAAACGNNVSHDKCLYSASALLGLRRSGRKVILDNCGGRVHLCPAPITCTYAGGDELHPYDIAATCTPRSPAHQNKMQRIRPVPARPPRARLQLGCSPRACCRPNAGAGLPSASR